MLAYYFTPFRASRRAPRKGELLRSGTFIFFKKDSNSRDSLRRIKSDPDCLRAILPGAPALISLFQRVVDRVRRVFRADLEARQALQIQPFALRGSGLLKDLFSYHVDNWQRKPLRLLDSFMPN